MADGNNASSGGDTQLDDLKEILHVLLSMGHTPAESRHHSRHTALIIQRVLPEASYTLWGFFPRRDLANVLFE